MEIVFGGNEVRLTIIGDADGLRIKFKSRRRKATANCWLRYPKGFVSAIEKAIDDNANGVDSFGHGFALPLNNREVSGHVASLNKGRITIRLDWGKVKHPFYIDLGVLEAERLIRDIDRFATC